MTGSQVTIEGTARDVATGFDYASLPEDEALQARAAASRIQRRNHKMIESIIENGQDLLAMKERLAQGQFEAWAEVECGIAPRTARNYMAAARQFRGKSALVADLPPSTIYALAAAPAVGAQVVEKREAGERLGEDTIADLLWREREEQKTAKAAEKLTP